MNQMAGRTGLVATDQRNGVAVILMAQPPENRLDGPMVRALIQALDQFLADPSVRVIALAGEGENFSLGSGLEFTVCNDFGTLVAKLDAAAKPVVAAISGYARGPALAVAMAAHFRIATPDALLTLPESAVGLLPAAGTVQRVTRNAGAGVAMDLCLYGLRIGAEDAVRSGLVDAIVDGELMAGIMSFSREILARRFGPRPAHLRPVPSELMGPALRQVTEARAKLGKTRLLAPQRILDAIEAVYLLPYAAGLRFEAQAAEDAQRDPAGRGLRHLAAAERGLPLTLLAANPDRRNGLSAEGMEIAGYFRAAWLLAARALLQTGVAEEAVDAAALAYGYAKGPFGTDAPARAKAGLAERLGDALIAEAARLMETGRLTSPAACDALATLATGFPRWRGGPLHAAEVEGLTQRLRAMEGWAALDPVWEIPEPLRAAALRGHWPRPVRH